MKKQLIPAVVALVSFAAQAGPLADLGAKLFAVTGAKSPVPVLGPGIQLNISGIPNGKVVSVFGDDKCSEPGRSGCTIIDKPVVTVHWVDGTKQVTEHWTVVKKGDLTYLARPDGTPVSQAN